MNSTVPRCSIVVPSYRSAATIGDCLRALIAQDAPFDYEVIVVDSSADGTAELVRREFPDVSLHHLPGRVGPETARNIGAKHAKGPILVFIDSDCIAPRDWLRRLVARLDEGFDAVGGATANGNGDSLVSWAGYMCEFREFFPGGPLRRMSYLSPNTVAYPTSLFLSVGGFPAGFYPMEDQLFHRPLEAAGARIVLDPEIVVAHMHRTDRRQFLEHQRLLGIANVRVLRTLGGRGAWLASRPLATRLLVPWVAVYRFLRLASASLPIERALLLRRPYVAWLCWLGMWWWSRGFLEGSRMARDTNSEPWQHTSTT